MFASLSCWYWRVGIGVCGSTAVYEWITKELRVPPEQIILYGKSLGTGSIQARLDSSLGIRVTGLGSRQVRLVSSLLQQTSAHCRFSLCSKDASVGPPLYAASVGPPLPHKSILAIKSLSQNIFVCPSTPMPSPLNPQPSPLNPQPSPCQPQRSTWGLECVRWGLFWCVPSLLAPGSYFRK